MSINIFSDLLKEPNPENLAWKVVEFVVPLYQKNGFTVALEILSIACMLLGALMLTYLVFTSITSAATKGEVLQDSNRLWAPLAVVVGFGMMIPLLDNGLSAVHVVIREFVAKPAINLADAITIAAAEHVIKDGRPLAPLSASGQELAETLLKSELCAHTYDLANKKIISLHEYHIPVFPPATATIKTDAADKTTASWGWGPQCGAIILTHPSGAEMGDFGKNRADEVEKMLVEIRKLDGAKIMKDLVEIHGFARSFMSQTAIEKWVESSMNNGVLPPLTDKLRAMGKQYDNAVSLHAAREAAKSQKDQRAKLVDGVKEYGALSFFAYFSTLTKINETTAAFASEKPFYLAPNVELWKKEHREWLTALNDVLKNQKTLEKRRQALTGDDFAFATEQDESLFASIINTATAPLVDYLTSYDGWKADPVSDLMNIGSNMMTTAKVGYGLALAATTVSNFWSSTAGKMVEFAMVPGWWLLGSLYIGGAMMSIILPNLPLIYGMFGFAVFVLELIVALIAGPIFCMIHCRLDSKDGFVNQANSIGYKVLFGLFLRLPINMIAFIGAMIANNAVLNVFLFIWSFAFRASVSGQTLGFAAIITSIALMLYMQWRIVVFMFSLNYSLSEKVGAFFGHNTQSYGEGSENAAVVGGIAGAAAGTAPKAMSSLGKQDQKSDKDKLDSNNSNNSGGGGKRGVRMGNS